MTPRYTHWLKFLVGFFYLSIIITHYGVSACLCVRLNSVPAKSFLPAKLSQQQSDGQETGEKD